VTSVLSAFRSSFRSSFRTGIRILLGAAAALWLATLQAQQNPQASPVVMEHDGSTVMFEPYAPNIVRVTLSMQHDPAVAAAGYGFVAKPNTDGWTLTSDDHGDTYRSSRLVVTLDASDHGRKPSLTQADIAKFFTGSTPGAHIRVATPEGATLVDMVGWQQSVPNHKDGNADVLYDKRPTDEAFFQVGATFVSPPDEHYYGLGQDQHGFLDHRGHTVDCWNDYNATGGASFCVPFAVTNKGYGLIWDNPSKTTVEPGFNEQTKWTSEVGNRVSFFVIAGRTTDEIYEGYRELTGATPMLPKAAYGFIQCKQRYITQDELLAVAKGYRERHLPLDVLVVDWFYYTKMGQFDMDPVKWPDPAAMNKQLHAEGIQTMISVWPRFTEGSRYYDLLLKKSWFEHLADGTPTNGLPYDKAGSDIDTTNPDAARWFWEIIRDNLGSKGFDSFWADETEPDLPPNGSYFSIGPGTRYFNVYPLFHTASIYDGFRRDLKTRALVMSRDAYLGAQRNGTMFWSSDIFATWNTLRRQVATGLDVTASGIAYWGNDIGGWQYLPSHHTPLHKPLLDPSDARDNVGYYHDYPELYTRWFEYGVFQPNFRTHGSRDHNEVWSYGKQAEPILEKYLRLRYELMPYIYSLGWRTHETGAPYMRALFMDFPGDPNVSELGDEYMFGPDLLVAPVTEQGATTKRVYLPAGADWYNYWTNERLRGGQWIEASAPIETIPLFVRAGSILPLGAPIDSTSQSQRLEKLRVYPGADADFALYNDDGRTYAYEKGESQITHLHWDDAAQKLTHTGGAAWEGSDTDLIEVVRPK
jgi:alpha-D-xyloside xylohydrolase